MEKYFFFQNIYLNNFYENNVDHYILIDIFDQGNSFMEDKNYSAAVNSYKSAIQINPYQSKVFYNLGNAYFRLDSLGHAVWAYSKALKLSPRDKNTIYNLNLTKDRLNIQFTYPKNYFLVSMLLKICLLVAEPPKQSKSFNNGLLGPKEAEHIFNHTSLKGLDGP